MSLRREVTVRDWGHIRQVMAERRIVEKIVVSAIVCGLGVLFVTGSRGHMHGCYGETKHDSAMFEAQKFANEAYPQWKQMHPGACPSIGDLVPYMDTPRVNDPWGSGYQLNCDAKGIYVWSLGWDRKPNTRDDITARSWR